MSTVTSDGRGTEQALLQRRVKGLPLHDFEDEDTVDFMKNFHSCGNFKEQ